MIGDCPDVTQVSRIVEVSSGFLKVMSHDFPATRF